MARKIAKTVIFILLAVILLTAYFDVFMFKTNDGIWQMKKFYEENDNSIDVIFLGSSHMFVNANTPTLWDEYGIASYDLGGSVQPYWNTYHYLIEAFKTQKPKVVVFDIFTAADVNTEYFAYENVIKNVFGMKLSENKLEAIKDSVTESDRNCYYYEYPTFHKRYVDDITKSDFTYKKSNYRDLNCWKGETLMYRSAPLPRPDDSVINDTTIGELTPKNEEFLRKIIELCKENDTPLLLVLNPYHVLDYQMPVFNKVQQIATETGTEYINFNLLYDEIGIDFDNDFSDACHMKYSGSANFSRYLAKELKSRYDIPDRRGQQGYESYDDMARLYKKVTSYEDEKSCEDIQQFVSDIDMAGRTIVCSVVGNYGQDERYDEYAKALRAYGIDLSDVSGNSIWVIDDGNIVYGAGSSGVYNYRKRLSRYNTLSIETIEEMYTDGSGVYTVPKLRMNTTYYSKADDGVRIAVYDKELDSIVIDKVFTSTKGDE